MAAKSIVVVGEKYGRLTIVSDGGKNKHSKTIVNCQCECGNTCTVILSRLKSGLTKSCGCYKTETTSERTRVDYTGLVHGRLTLLKDVGSKNGSRMWLSQCECGNLHVVQASAVAYGNILSCGCLFTENVKAANTTHGMSRTREYSTYNGMLARCYNENSEKYEIYGKRGIVVCDEWLESFSNFYRDMGDKPEGLTLERIDVNGNYCKENCFWDTPTEQAYNQRRRKDNKSGRVGVSDKSGFWIAQIWKGRKQYDLGKFKTYEEALAAREAAEIEHYGYLKNKV